METTLFRVCSKLVTICAIFVLCCSHRIHGTKKCKEITLPAHGIALKNRAMALYNTAEFACRHGYRLVGSRWRVCTQSGKWTGLPAKCEDIDECAAQGQYYPCHQNADCINTIGSYHCVCLPGFHGNGVECKRSEYKKLSLSKSKNGSSRGADSQRIQTHLTGKKDLLRPSSDTCGIVVLKNNTINSRKRFRRVVGGKVAYPGEWPWQASIEIKKKVRLPFMGGALVKPGWVVTVASQLFIGARMVLPKEVKVILGEHDKSKHEQQEQRFEVKNIFIHPKFDREKVSYDIALLKLKKKEKRTAYVNPICLVGGRRARVFEDQEHLATVTGWGTTSEVDIGQDPGLFSRHLREATIPLRNTRTCKKATAYNFHSRSMLCAGFIDGSASPCFGDHGAPLMIQDPYSNRWVLIGLYSWSEGCGKREKFSYYTRVSKFRKWITSLIRHSP